MFTIHLINGVNINITKDKKTTQSRPIPTGMGMGEKIESVILLFTVLVERY